MAYNIKNYEQASVTTDAVLLSYDKQLKKLKVILIKRPESEEFYPNKFTLIGGFTHPNEYFIDACINTLKRKINIDLQSHQLFEQRTISTPYRDPRGWIVSVPYISYLNEEQFKQLDQSTVCVIDCDITNNELTLSLNGQLLTKDDFGFDHYDILIANIKEVVKSTEWSLRFTLLLGNKFTLKDAFDLYKTLNPESSLIINNFKRKFKDLLVQTTQTATSKKPGIQARLYKVKHFY